MSQIEATIYALAVFIGILSGSALFFAVSALPEDPPPSKNMFIIPAVITLICVGVIAWLVWTPPQGT